MAILRGGRRIGNFDIRLGLPRDKSLIDVRRVSEILFLSSIKD